MRVDAPWFDRMRLAGASDSEITKYLQAANASMKTMLDVGSSFVESGLAGNRHERRRAMSGKNSTRNNGFRA
jgi:hypothetical protein